MATFNETASGGILLNGSITLAFTAATCFSFDMLQLKNEERYMLTRNSNANRQSAFIPNVVNCRQSNLRTRVTNGNFSSRE